MSDMVRCFACDGDGYNVRNVPLTSNPRAHCDVIVEDCGLCGTTGEITREEAEAAYSYPYGGQGSALRSFR